jgi:acyl-CoA synthetase (AMP-forming)/AMP-acid ligase II
MIIEAGSHFSLATLRFSNREAVRCDGKSRSFRALRDAANRIGSAIASLPVSQGGRVGVLSHNRIEVVELWLGLERFNLVRVVLHSHFEMATHVETLDEVGAEVLVFDARFAEQVEKHRDSLRSVKHLICIGDPAPSWAMRYEALQAKGRPEDPHIEIDEEAPCFLQLTSGTTGRPKPWTVSHRAWRAIIANNLEHLDTFGSGIVQVGPEDVNLHFHALQWATGFQTLMPYLMRGALTVILDDSTFDPKRIAATILDERITGTLMPAPMLPAIADALVARGAAKTHMRRMVIFFATPELLDLATRLFGRAWCHGFGSTEQGAPATRLTSEEAAESRKRLESVGRPASPFFEMAVVDEKGQRLPPGEVGEIVVRSAMSAGSYWNLGEKTDEAFFPGGWFRPSDIGYIDEDGFLYYLDRAKDRIVTSGGVVYPHLVEAILLRHSSVANCGVVGLGALGKQSVLAAVVLKNPDEAAPVAEAAILALAAANLPAHARPTRVAFVDDLPTVLGGAKVQREVLQRRLSSQGAVA